MNPFIPDNNLTISVQKYVFVFSANTGVINWVTSSAIPSQLEAKRVWNFNMSGTLFKEAIEYEIIGNFNNVDTYGYDVTFEGPLQGTITTNGKVLDAQKYMRYVYVPEQKQMIFFMKNLGNKGLVLFNLFINDSCTTPTV